MSSSSFSSSASTAATTTAAAIEYAQRIWDGDNTVYDDLDHVVEWIGDGKPFSNSILQSYMAHFDFKDLYLEQSFRNLCSKLYLKGETQQIDRVLFQFSIRYFECNPRCIFATPDVIHAIVYSLLLLNTDLHVAQGDYKKMTRTAFVKNTMSAIYAQLENTPAAAAAVAAIASEMDEQQQRTNSNSGVSFQHHQSMSSSTTSMDWMPSSLQRTPSNQSALSTRSLSNHTLSTDNCSLSRINNYYQIIGSATWQFEVKHVLKQMYANVRNTQINNPSSYSPPPSTTPSNNSNGNSNNSNNSNRMSTAFKRSVGTIIWKNSSRESMINNPEDSSISSSVQSVNSTSIMQYQSVAFSHLQNIDLPSSYTSNAPYYKEGMVVRKHLLERTNQKARHRDWKDCFMLIERSQLRMYKLDTNTSTPSNTTLKRHTIRNSIMPRSSATSPFTDNNTASQLLSSSHCDAGTTTAVVGGGDWMANAQLIGSIDLKHTLANVLPSGYSRQRQYAFALQQSNGAVYLFQVGSPEQTQEWVSTCNYWAARESKEPLAEGVSSMEYGWGDCLQKSNSNDTIINEWEAPTPMMSSSMLEETAQLKAFCKHVQELSIELDQHRDIKPKIEKHFQHNSKLKSKVMNNWEAKSHYLLHEIIKYQNYCNSIETSLSLQSKVVMTMKST